MTGFWPDNWVGNRLDVVFDPRDHARKLRIIGRPVADMTLLVSSTGRQLERLELRRGVRESAAVELPAGPRELITFAFSDHVVDDNGRSVAFLVEETNLFSEEDLHALA